MGKVSIDNNIYVAKTQKMNKTNDKMIRNALHGILREILLAELKQQHGQTGHPAKIISEFGVNHGSHRVDIATINGIIHGYEIKSDLDNLDRLPDQAKAYGEVFDKVTLVTGERHLIEAVEIIPDWWGVKVARANNDGEVIIRSIRSATQNKEQRKTSVARLLWRQEALGILEEIGKDSGVRSKRCEYLYERLSTELSTPELGRRVREILLTTRQGWRSDQLRLQYDGRS